jgi:isopenicillin N synthase-like dioxygenase
MPPIPLTPLCTSSAHCSIVHLIAITLGLPETFFDASFIPPVTVLRPLHYSAIKSDPGAGLMGCGAHTDYGMITVLATDDVPGLQAHVDGEWVDVDPVPGGGLGGGGRSSGLVGLGWLAGSG